MFTSSDSETAGAVKHFEQRQRTYMYVVHDNAAHSQRHEKQTDIFI